MTDALLDKLRAGQKVEQLSRRNMIRAERDAVIARMWRMGYDTKAIADHQHVRECEIANRLAQLRDEGAL